MVTMTEVCKEKSHSPPVTSDWQCKNVSFVKAWHDILPLTQCIAESCLRTKRLGTG